MTILSTIEDNSSMYELHTIIQRSLDHYRQFEHEKDIVTPSLPIIYFGNLQEYLNSSIKIITVGKNPSYHEFCLPNKCDYSFFRFPAWETDKNLKDALDCYFEIEPLTGWFDKGYEPILKEITASYYKKNNQPNRAIHTDICSPLATNPTWSKLEQQDKIITNKLFIDGFELWYDLINILKPDILLISVAEKWLEKLELQDRKIFKEFPNKESGEARKEAYRVYQSSCQLNSKSTKVFFGKGSIIPFMDLANSYKSSLGKEILKSL